MTSPSNANLGAVETQQITGIIEDDDDAPEASISSTHSAPEGSGDNATRGADSLVVTLSAPSTKTVKVNYAFTDDTATRPDDYTGTDHFLTFTPDPNTGITDTTMLIPFSIIQDYIADGDEIFYIDISIPNDGNATPHATDTRSTVTINDFLITTVSIVGGAAVNEGQVAEFTVSTDEVGPARLVPLTVNLTASEDGTNFIAGTHSPTVSIPVGATSAIYRVPTLNDNVAGSNSGFITVTIDTSATYGLGITGTSARVGVRDNAGIRGPEAYISDAVATAEGTEMVFTVNLARRPSLNTNVYYTIHSASTAEVGVDYTSPALNYVTFRRGSRFPVRRPGEITKQIRIPIIHDRVDESVETIVIELTSASANYAVDRFENRATGTITDHANDIVMISVEDSVGLEGEPGENKDIPVTLRLDIPSSRDIAVDWETSLAIGGANDATADDFFVKTSDNPAVIPAGQLTSTFNVQSIGDNRDNEGDETFTVTISNPTNDAQIANASATVTIKSDDIPVLSIEDGVEITEADPSDSVVNAEFTITTTEIPVTNPLPVHYTVISANFLTTNTLTTTSSSIMFDSGTNEGTLSIPINNDDIAEAFGSLM